MSKGFIGLLVGVVFVAAGLPVAADAAIQCNQGDFKVYDVKGEVAGCLPGKNVEQEAIAARERQDIAKNARFFKAGTSVTLLSGIEEKCPEFYKWVGTPLCAIDKNKVR